MMYVAGICCACHCNPCQCQHAPGSFSGRTTGFEPVNGGPNPSPGAMEIMERLAKIRQNSIERYGEAWQTLAEM